MSTSNPYSDYVTDYEWDLLDSIGMTDYFVSDMLNGPTIGDSNSSGSADIIVANKDDTLASYTWKMGNGKKQTVNIHSDGIWTVDSGVTDIDLMNQVSWSDRSSGWNWYTEYRTPTAVDASAATDFVTFQGIDKNKWYHRSYGTKDDYGLPDYGNGVPHGLTYQYNNVFKGGDYGNWISGGQGDDTLIGGQGDDEFHAVGGETIMYGVGGDNKFYMGSGSAIAYGGEGNDYFNFVKNGGSAFGGGGDNIFVAGNVTTGTSIDIVGGTGTNTFVLGNVPMGSSVEISKAHTTMQDIAEAGILTAGEKAVGLLPGGSILWDIGEATVGFINEFLDGSADTITTEAPQQDVIEIWDFNPTKDKLLVPMNAGGSDNIKMEWNSTGGYIEIIDETGSDSVIAKVHLADESEIFGTAYTPELTPYLDKYVPGFLDALQRNALIVDGQNGATLNGANGTTEYIEFDGMGDLGTNRFMLVGAWKGNVMVGPSADGQETYFMGTDHDDVLWAYNPNKNDPDWNAGTTSNVFFGFAGDNLFVGGGGSNTYHGGTGSDLVAYYDAEFGLNITMNQGNSDSNGSYFEFKNGFGEYTDKVYKTVEGIIGSKYSDNIVGNSFDNVFYSTGSDEGSMNEWTGKGGSNTFHMTGGTSHITDFSESDTLVVHRSSYTFSENLFWVEGDDDWTLYDSVHDQEVALVDKTDDFAEQPPEVTMLQPNDQTKVFTPEIGYYDLIA